MSQRMKILLVEDNPGDARLLKEYLAEGGKLDFELKQVERLSQALEALKTESFDLVFLDLSLPDSGGLETISSIHQKAPHLPIIVMTGLDDEQVGIQAVQEGAQDYLVKGTVNSQLLLRSLRYAIQRKQMEQSLQEKGRQQKAILNNIPDIAWLKDKESRFIAVNEPFGLACGVKLEDLAGKTDLDIWPRLLAEKYRADDREVMQSGKSKILEEPLADKEGKMEWIETIKTPIYNDTGEVIGTTGIARDITQRRKAQEEKEKLIQELKEALTKVKTLSGLLPICASCKKIRDDKGYWEQLEGYIESRSEAEFTHGLCPECVKKLYPEFFQG